MSRPRPENSGRGGPGLGRPRPALTVVRPSWRLAPRQVPSRVEALKLLEELYSELFIPS